jgi:hypothetical protein
MYEYDEETDTYYTTSHSNALLHGKKGLIVVAYFVLVSPFAMLAQALRMGMPGMLAALGIAALMFFCMRFLFKHLRTKFASTGLSLKDWLSIMFLGGVSRRVIQPVKVVSADGTALKDEPQENTVSRAVAQRDLNAPDAYIADRPDEYGRPTRFIQNEPIMLAENFQPSIRSLLGQTVLLLGLRRSGKSNGMAVFFEELGRYTIPFVLFDTEDEYGGMAHTKYLPRYVVVCNPESSAMVQREYDYAVRIVETNPDGAHDLGRAIMDGELQAVVNLRSWDDETAAQVMIGMIEGIQAWEQERRYLDRIPVIVGLDEGAKWFPQNAKPAFSKDTYTQLQNAFFQIVVGQGGKRGFGLIVSALKYAMIDKRLLQTTWKLLFKETEEVELDQYDDWGIDRERVLGLQQGECFIFNHLVSGFKLQLRRKSSPDFSATPGMDNLMRHAPYTRRITEILSRSYTSKRTEELPEQRALIPVKSPEPEVTKEEYEPQEPEKSLLDRAIEFYEAGAKTQPALAAALDLSLWQVRPVWAQLQNYIKEKVGQ